MTHEEKIQEAAKEFGEGLGYSPAGSTGKLMIALLVLMEERPYDEITVGEICGCAGLSRKTFYKHFGSKEDMLRELSDELGLAFSLYKGKLEKQNGGSVDSWVHYFMYWYEMRRWAVVLERNGLFKSVAGITEYNKGLLSKREWLSPLLRDGENVMMLYSFVNAGAVEMVQIWARENFRKTPEEMAELLNLFLSGHIYRK